jgi:hypothetical protein
MSLIYQGARRTPKQMAALLLLDKIAELPADWTPGRLPDLPSPRERALVGEQIRQYQHRIRRLLGLAAGSGAEHDPESVIESEGTCGSQPCEHGTSRDHEVR